MEIKHESFRLENQFVVAICSNMGMRNISAIA